MTPITALRRYWLFIFYLVWICFGVSLYAIPIQLFYIDLLYICWIVASLIVITGVTLFKYADSLKSWLITIGMLLIILPVVFITTGFLAGRLNEAIHKRGVVQFIQEINATGFAPSNYHIRNPEKFFTLKPRITENYELETIPPDDFEQDFTFIVQFDNGIIYQFNINRTEEIAWVWELSFYPKE